MQPYGQLRGALPGHRAAIHVWACSQCYRTSTRCPYKPEINGNDWTRSRPRPCPTCGSTTWTHSASKKENARYFELIWLAKAGRIINLKHPAPALILTTKSISVPTTTDIAFRRYTADFYYEEVFDGGKGQPVWEDHKARPEIPEITRLVHLLVWHQHGVEIRVSYYGRDKRLCFAPTPSRDAVRV